MALPERIFHFPEIPQTEREVLIRATPSAIIVLDRVTRDVASSFTVETATLTRTECDLLRYLMLNQGLILTRRQIMQELWADKDVSSRTVDIHIARLRNKLGDQQQGIIVSKSGLGYGFRKANERSK